MLDLTPFGLAVGHATDPVGVTGCTVVRGLDAPFRCAHALVGRASGARELAVATPAHLVDRIDALLLTGGSAYGLDAAAGVMRWMEARGRGYPVGVGVVPIVPAAVLFDLGVGDARARPTPDLAHAACEAATAHVDAAMHGSVGAGTGATIGKALGPTRAMKGGVGMAVVGDGAVRAFALAAVNAFGDVRDADGRIVAGARADDATAAPFRFADTARTLAAQAAAHGGDARSPFGNTTLAVVALSVPLAREALAQLAHAATGALHRRITPCGTSYDGDVLFALSPLPPADAPAPAPPVPIVALEALAAEALARAIEDAVRTARGLPGLPGLADAPPR